MATKPDTENKLNKKEEDKTLSDLISELNVSPEQGLSDSEANERISKYGYNELIEEKVNPLLKFLGYFWGPIPWMIEAAVILSAIVHHWADFWIIFVLLLMNAVVGFWEEYQAGNAIDALKKKLALEARVRRDGKWKNIPARELVPGDIVRLRLGDIIPADAKLTNGDPIEVDQSTLTGESLPVERKKKIMFIPALSSTRVKSKQLYMQPGLIPISARPHKWSKKAKLPVTSSVQC